MKGPRISAPICERGQAGGAAALSNLRRLQPLPCHPLDYSSQSTDLRVALFPALLVVVIYFVSHRTPLA